MRSDILYAATVESSDAGVVLGFVSLLRKKPFIPVTEASHFVCTRLDGFTSAAYMLLT